jgi:germacradienol/geosmin synthase
MEDTASDYACLTNDIFSYQKEIEFEGEVHNGVLATQNFLGCGPAQAVSIVNDLMTERMRQFEHVVGTELPALFDEYELGCDARAALRQRAQQLQDWMAGIMNWHVSSGRYRPDELVRRYRPAGPPTPPGPTGLGTHAACIRDLMEPKVPGVMAAGRASG